MWLIYKNGPQNCPIVRISGEVARRIANFISFSMLYKIWQHFPSIVIILPYL